ncbi:hypothetical protein [Yinghuangia sp. YIM S10712]|uniref:hypothetical protein n=1 Tax=Yinghuangia sp. YIM S10712 TaxID=3436930 RepID=UPI003F536594
MPSLARFGRRAARFLDTTTLIVDPRDYVYAVVRKTTSPPAPGVVGWVGVSLGVRLKGDPTLYRSDNGHADWSLSRDYPAATTIRLPAGTRAADIAEIVAVRTVFDADTGSSVTANGVNPVVPVPADAALLDRVVVVSGRDPAWQTRCRSRRAREGSRCVRGRARAVPGLELALIRRWLARVGQPSSPGGVPQLRPPGPSNCTELKKSR